MADSIAAVERAVPLVEKHVLTDLVTKQLNGGQVTVDNVYPHLWRGYEHFRDPLRRTRIYRRRNPRR